MSPEPKRPMKHIDSRNPVLGAASTIRRAELIADGVVHAVGIVLAIAAGSVAAGACGLPHRARRICRRRLLRRLAADRAVDLAGLQSLADHAGQMDPAPLRPRGDLPADRRRPTRPSSPSSTTQRPGSMIAVVWGAAAIAGMAIKLFLPGRFDRLAVVFYLAIGWSGVVDRAAAARHAAADHALADRSPAASSIRAASCSSPGSRLRFQNAVWHGFVVAGAGLHLRGGHRLPGVARL